MEGFVDRTPKQQPSTAQTKRTSTAFVLETLESRRLMTATLENGVLTVMGTEGADQIAIFESHGTITVQQTTTGLVEDRVTWKVSRTADFAGTQVCSIRVEAGAGDDDVWVASGSYEPFGIPLFIDGGPGHDVLGGGDAADTIVGGDGDDWIVGNSTADGLWAD